MINKKIIQIIEKSGFNKNDIIVYLLSLHFNFGTSYIPDLIKEQTNRLNIITREYKTNTLVWNIPLFDVEIKKSMDNTEWDWVNTEYRKLFMDVKKTAGGAKASCINKMMKYFSEHPSVRKDEILEAASLYILEFANGTNDPKFMQRADYFISKAVVGEGGKSVESRLSQYLEIIDLSKLSKDKKQPLMRGLQ